MRNLLIVILTGLALCSARADTPAETARTIITSQMQAFERDDAATAFSYAAPTIHRLFGAPDVFMRMVAQGYAPVYRHKSYEFGETRLDAGRLAQVVHLLASDGTPWVALYSLEQQDDGSWKISGCVLLKEGDGAA